ncbi:hypothetical protein N9O13_06095 [Crocinitomicaceae bacterium]|nr:hypothetical protein [Crocinitomicaceae bacterium]
MKYLIAVLVLCSTFSALSQKTYGVNDVWYIYHNDSTTKHRFDDVLDVYQTPPDVYIIDNSGDVVNGTLKIYHFLKDKGTGNLIEDDLGNYTTDTTRLKLSYEIKNGLLDGVTKGSSDYEYYYNQGKLIRIKKYHSKIVRDSDGNYGYAAPILIADVTVDFGRAVLLNGRNIEIFEGEERIFTWRSFKKGSEGQYRIKGFKLRFIENKIISVQANSTAERYTKVYQGANVLGIGRLRLVFNKKGAKIKEFSYRNTKYIYDNKTKSYKLKEKE